MSNLFSEKMHYTMQIKASRYRFRSQRNIFYYCFLYEFCKIECFCHPACQAKVGEGWRNSIHFSYEGSPLIMRFFVECLYKFILRPCPATDGKTNIFLFCRTYNNYLISMF